MLNVAIIGVTGYAGEELIRILIKHPKVQIVSVSAKIDKPCRISELYPDLKAKIDLVCTEPDIDEILKTADCIFLALPHTVSMSIAPQFVKKGKVVIDLSADYRLNSQIYQEHYKCKHTDAENLKNAVYGLPEANRQSIKKAKLIANPGCYPTAALLALLPLLKQKVKLESIYIDAKSGTSGAGRNPNLKMEEFISKHNLKAYKINCHQHAPEIQAQIEQISNQNPEFVFVPHLMPFERGILETIYIKSPSHPFDLVRLRSPQVAQGRQVTKSPVIELYKEFYKNEPFVRVLDEGQFPELIDVVRTNFCEIGLKIEDNLIIIVSAIDNLLKGASGQAVENMNIIYQFEEKLGLI